MAEHYEWNDLDSLVFKAAGIASGRYHRYGVTFEDFTNEIYAWLYEHRAKVRGWLNAKPQRTTRIFRSFLDVALHYGEIEKAARVGYDPEDVTWYSPSLVEGLLPLALDDEFYPEMIQESDQGGKLSTRKPPSEGDDLLVRVLDIRRALDKTGLRDWFMEHEPAIDDIWTGRIGQLVDYLGGERPYVGRRKPLTNSEAQAITRSVA